MASFVKDINDKNIVCINDEVYIASSSIETVEMISEKDLFVDDYGDNIQKPNEVLSNSGKEKASASA